MRKIALSLGERVSRSGAFTSRSATGEGSVEMWVAQTSCFPEPAAFPEIGRAHV